MTAMKGGAILLAFVTIAACDGGTSKSNSCEDALRAASKRVPELQDSKKLAETVSACIAEQWPAETRKCVAEVRDRPDYTACLLRYEEHKPVKLSVKSIDPAQGDAAGGTFVQITGTRFIADGARNAKVYFGAKQGTVVRFASDTELVVRAPDGTPNETVDVVVTFEPGGELKLAQAFKFIEDMTRVAMTTLRQFTDDMCACKDTQCAQEVSDEMTRWTQEMSRTGKLSTKPSEADAKEFQALGTRMGECMQRAMTP